MQRTGGMRCVSPTRHSICRPQQFSTVSSSVTRMGWPRPAGISWRCGPCRPGRTRAIYTSDASVREKDSPFSIGHRNANKNETKIKVMNNQFDKLAKELAQSLTRRGALKKFGAGLAGMALALLGLAARAHAD